MVNIMHMNATHPKHIYMHAQKHPCLTHHHLPTQCLHPGVVVDLADSDDEDCPFKPLEEPVTAETQGALAECLFAGWSVGMLSLIQFDKHARQKRVCV